MQSYVQQRMAELAAKAQSEMAWLMFLSMWEDLSRAAEHKRRADLNMEAYNSIRSKYVKRGRKPGYSPKTPKAA